jgi:hypothetical protein
MAKLHRPADVFQRCVKMTGYGTKRQSKSLKAVPVGRRFCTSSSWAGCGFITQAPRGSEPGLLFVLNPPPIQSEHTAIQLVTSLASWQVRPRCRSPVYFRTVGAGAAPRSKKSKRLAMTYAHQTKRYNAYDVAIAAIFIVFVLVGTVLAFVL